MRQLFFAFILLNLLCYPSYAAPCYGTKMPKSRQFFSGAQTYSIFQRHLEDGHGELRSVQHFFLLSYGIYDWLSIDLKGGAGNIKQHPFEKDEVDYPSGFAGGYGIRLRLYEEEKVKVVFGFQHISVHPRRVRLGHQKNQAILDDWQVSLLGSYQIFSITPYVGTRWSRIDYIHWVEEDRKRRMSDSAKSIGLIFGFDIPLNEKVWLNIEGQFFDSEALAFSVNFEF
ncbi:MAG: hypothetical protein JSW40_09240 [Candidatus Omnitrophota bacterium]|nr:MAG: hypothetical protein JSW40_09240 [Candidatus Omnitrophota bacterium]